MMRWGGIFADYYRWREGVGPRTARPPLVNLLWGGIESNQVGTGEFVGFCREVGAEPLVCVNFESDGRRQVHAIRSSVRTAGCEGSGRVGGLLQRPGQRGAHAHTARRCRTASATGRSATRPRTTGTGSTSRPPRARLSSSPRPCGGRTRSVRLIAWGDSGWAGRMAEIAGEHVHYLAFHHMLDPDDPKQPVLRGELYRQDPDATWAQLMKAWELTDAKIRTMREAIKGRPIPLALTECHFTIPGRDRCDVLATWAAGVSYARILNNHERHGDVLEDRHCRGFLRHEMAEQRRDDPGAEREQPCVPPAGRTRDAPVPPPHRQPRRFASPAPRTRSTSSPAGATNTLFLHVANTLRTRAVRADLQVQGGSIRGGRVFEISGDTSGRTVLPEQRRGDADDRTGAGDPELPGNFRRRRFLRSNCSFRPADAVISSAAHDKRRP